MEVRMEDLLQVAFSSDRDDEDCCNLMVSRRDPDGVTNILASYDGIFARLLYKVLTDSIR